MVLVDVGVTSRLASSRGTNEESIWMGGTNEELIWLGDPIKEMNFLHSKRGGKRGGKPIFPKYLAEGSDLGGCC